MSEMTDEEIMKQLREILQDIVVRIEEMEKRLIERTEQSK